jgi:hypothetical protein
MDEIELLSNINDVLQVEISQRHSYFQLKYFLLGKEPTNQAKLWQSLRELKNRYDSLMAINLEIEESKDNIELLNIHTKRIKQKIEKSINDKQQILQIKLRKLERRQKSAQHGINQLLEKKKWLTEESRFFLEFFKNLRKVEELKPFDDLESQKQYWGEKLMRKINLKSLLQSSPDVDLIETALALPDDIPFKKQIVEHLNSIQAKIVEMKNTKKLGC